MRLSKDQLTIYDRDGFLVLPELFSPREVEAMKADLQRIQTIDTDHLVRERGSNVAKTIYRVHEADGPTASPIFHPAARSPRLLAPAQQLLADDALYVYHTKCNLKSAIDGSVWQWHQDYGSWRRDGVPELVAAIEAGTYGTETALRIAKCDPAAQQKYIAAGKAPPPVAATAPAIAEKAMLSSASSTLVAEAAARTTTSVTFIYGTESTAL